MPFDFLKRKKAPGAEASAPAAAPAEEGTLFEGLTEEWRLLGRMMIPGRMSDALNKREPISIVDVTWAPIDDSEALAPAPGLKSGDSGSWRDRFPCRTISIIWVERRLSGSLVAANETAPRHASFALGCWCTRSTVRGSSLLA